MSWNEKQGNNIIQKLKIFATIPRLYLVTSSNLYFITGCVKRWSCMIFLWLLHVKYYNIVASKDLWNGSVVTFSLSGFYFSMLFLPFFLRKFVFWVQPYDTQHWSVCYFFVFFIRLFYIIVCCICIICFKSGILQACQLNFNQSVRKTSLFRDGKQCH